MTIEKEIKINYGLQVFRAVACLAVLLQHVNYYVATSFNVEYFKTLPIDFGRVGVFAFFCLSGFVITKSMRHGYMFIVHRFMRIFPAFWLALLLSYFVFGYAFNQEWHLSISDFFLFPGSLMGNYHIPYWTLVYECAFYYFMYSAIIFNLQSKTSMKLVLLLWLLVIVVYNKYEMISIFEPNAKILLSTVNVFFIAGALLALTDLRFFEKVPSTVLAFSSIVMWTIAESVPDYSLVCVFNNAIAFIFAMICIMRIKINISNPFGRLIVAIGDASYGIYLTHVIFIVALLKLKDLFGLQMSFLTTSIVVATLTLFIAGLFGLFDHRLYKWISSIKLDHSAVNANKLEIFTKALTKYRAR